jgi:DNA topoisomerase I
MADVHTSEEDEEIAVEDPVKSARSAGLRYVNDEQPGIRRRRRGKGFSYTGPNGEPITDEATLARIRSLAIPPAWTDVWICPHPKGHIQATGRDDKGRKQYRYHPRWREVRDEAKFDRMIAFGKALPVIHQKTDEHLALRGMPREKILAVVVRLLESSLIRVGNPEYTKQNRSYGLTTLRTRHVDVTGSNIHFKFRGKSGKLHDIAVRDRRLAGVVRKLLDLPGQDLFQYADDDGVLHTVRSEDVNAYLHEITGQDFTAKDFRTWAATVLAARALHEIGQFDSQAQAKKNVVKAVESVAMRLGNTPTICRKCYIHPAVVNAYLDGSAVEVLRERAEEELAESLAELPPEEAAVLAFLQQRLNSTS